MDLIYKINKNFSTREVTEYKKIISSLCKEIDTNGDGIITYDEFKYFIINHGLNKK